MKIRTFLQIVRSGKITASQKANLSINKKIVSHEFKICTENNVVFRLIRKYSLFNQRFSERIEFTDNLEGLCQPPSWWCSFYGDIYAYIENRTDCYVFQTNLFTKHSRGKFANILAALTIIGGKYRVVIILRVRPQFLL